MKRGFTLIEILLTLAIIAMLFSISSVLLSNIIPKANVESVAETLLSEIRHQQLRSMSGDIDSTGNANQFGIYISGQSYTLFEGSNYNPLATSNIVYNLDSPTQISTNFPGQVIIFNRGSGEIANYSAGSASITITDTMTSSSRILNYNLYGIPE